MFGFFQYYQRIQKSLNILIPFLVIGEKKMGKDEIRCIPATGEACCVSCCKLEALVSVDERGQIVLPKEIREKAGIKAGDKLAIITSEKGEKVCCISLIKAEEFKESIKKTFGPLFEELFR